MPLSGWIVSIWRIITNRDVAPAVTLAIVVILSLSDQLAQAIGILTYRENFRGLWWLIFIFASCVSLWRGLSSLGKYLLSKWQSFQRSKLRHQTEEKKRLLHEQQKKEYLQCKYKRLKFCSDGEKKLISKCLREGQQSVNLEYGNTAAKQLVAKEILFLPSQHPHYGNAIYMFYDEIWGYLINNIDSFLTPDDEEAIKLPSWMVR